MPIHKNQTLRLEVESLSSDGSGVARHEGQVVFIPFAAPGDLLQVKIVKAQKSHAFGRIEQVVRPGPGRIRPDCVIEGKCGGCNFRHLSYEAELDAKQRFVQDAVTRIGHIGLTVAPILPSPVQFGYRNKVQLPLQQGADGIIATGYYAPRSHRIVPCTTCHLHPAEADALAKRTTELLQNNGVRPYDEATRKGQVRHLYIRKGTHTGQLMLCIVATRAPLHAQSTIVEALTEEFPTLRTIVLNINPANTNVILGKQNITLHGEGYIEDRLGDVPLRLDPMSFAQVNTLAAEGIFAQAREYAAVQPSETLLDLYCGAGVIGLSMAESCKQLIGVEIVPEAIENAKASAEKMGLAEKTRFLCADAGTAAAQLAEEGLRPDVVTLDPPRKGCNLATIEAVCTMAPSRIVMVSCNPATMARDLAAFTERGYTVQRVRPADMFPRTKHVECIALLHKNQK